ncbi:pantoate--beta-alanine ligase [Aureimonas frigidaquae]|uniref:Pantothenate synthetase n=1 Tax=Aureimonas frigidaquae TaxID=424757 RepID=A0A0P0Z005_9HYPH|nr:pantoate--beta-alanine ligase [Aureimonas frigidaquae]BAT27255.1 pantoate--beta-alanine ligase [Aureimonas frigidaquae]
MSGLRLIRTRRDLRAEIGAWKAAGLTVGVVPTMGALHEGHLSLVERARAETDRVIVTLFVNPRQFNSAADLAAYPRTEGEDFERLVPAGAHILYVPDPEEVYPPGFATTISVGGVTQGLCGAFRPGHFDGVATVVAKLLLQSQADRAYFGEKDYQQLLTVQRLVADLDLPTRIVPCPTLRDSDGLAMSSRNRRLSPQERDLAGALPRALFDAAGRIGAGEATSPVLASAREALLAAGFSRVEYLELRNAADLAPVETLEGGPARLLVAAFMGEVRLIDNVPVTMA